MSRTLNRRRAIQARFNPPLPDSTFDDWRKRGIIPDPDVMMGRTPYWYDETVDGITEQPRITRRRDATAKTG